MTRPQIFTFITNQKLSWILQIMSCFFWVTSFIYPNQTKMHALETSFSRALIGFILNYIIMIYFKGQINLKNPKTNWLVTYRSVSNTLYGMLIALVMFYLPMPIIHTISSTSIIFTAGIEHNLYGVHLSNRSQWLIVVSLFGVMLQANGQYITQKLFHGEDQQFHRDSKFRNYVNIGMLQSVLLSVFMLVCAFLWSFGLVFVKQVNVHNNIILLWIVGILYCYIPQQHKSPIQTILYSILYSGFLVFLAQLTFVLSLQICKSVGIIMTLNTLNIGIAYIYSLIRYNQKLDVFSLFGMVVTLLCIFFIISDRYG